MSISISERLAIQRSVEQYVIATERFEDASKKFNDSCEQVRSTLGGARRVVCKVGHSLYMVDMDAEKNFQVEKLDII